jgi:hypothetical protein
VGLALAPGFLLSSDLGVIAASLETGVFLGVNFTGEGFLGDGFGPILFFSNFFGESFLSEIFVN